MKALTQDTFSQILLEQKQTGLVLFVKEGCPICQELHPLMEEIELGYQEQPFGFYLVLTHGENCNRCHRRKRIVQKHETAGHAYCTVLPQRRDLQ